MQRKVSFRSERLHCWRYVARAPNLSARGRGSYCCLYYGEHRTRLPTAKELHTSLVCAGIQQLLLSLEKLSPKLEGREDDIQFLKDMLQTEEFHSVVRVYNSTASHTVQYH